jgi:hypothetical protein
MGLADRLCREFRRAGHEQRAGAGALETDHLRIYGRLGHLVGRRDHLLLEIALQDMLECGNVIFAEVVILIEDRVFRIGQRLGQILGVNLPFGVVAHETRGRQRERRNVGELARAGHDRDRRYASRLQIFRGRRIAGRTELAEHERHLVAFDELAGMLDRLRRAVGIVIGDVVDRAPIDAATIVDVLDVGEDTPADEPDR